MRIKLPELIAATFAQLLTSGLSVSAQVAVLPRKINIYCTSNLDGTGQCFEVKTNTLLKCTAVPGEIIPCRVPGGSTYNCIFFSDALLACNAVAAKTIEERADKIQTRSPFESDFDDVLGEPLVSPTDRQPRSINENRKVNPKETEDTPKKQPINTIIMPAW